MNRIFIFFHAVMNNWTNLKKKRNMMDIKMRNFSTLPSVFCKTNSIWVSHKQPAPFITQCLTIVLLMLRVTSAHIFLLKTLNKLLLHEKVIAHHWWSKMKYLSISSQFFTLEWSFWHGYKNIVLQKVVGKYLKHFIWNLKVAFLLNITSFCVINCHQIFLKKIFQMKYEKMYWLKDLLPIYSFAIDTLKNDIKCMKIYFNIRSKLWSNFPQMKSWRYIL